MAKKHIMANPKGEAMLGLAAFLAGWLLLKDAYDDRGHDQPRWMRPFTWW